MMDYSNLTQSEQLTLLLDGELHEPHDSAIYSALASNDELREEFRELMAIRDTVRRDTEAFTPPRSATERIFKSLGFAVPTPFNQAPVQIPAAPVQSSSWSRYVSKYALTAVSSLTVFMVTFLFVSNHFENKISELSNGNKVAMQNSIGKTTGNIAGIELQKDNVTLKENSFKQRIKKPVNNSIKAGFIPAFDESNKNNEVVENIQNENVVTEKDKNIELIKNHPVQYQNFISAGFDNLNRTALNDVEMNMPQPTLSYNQPVLDKKHRSPVILQLKQHKSWSYPNVNTIDPTASGLNDKSIGIYLPINPDFRLGVEFGQESFGQVYNTLENNEKVHYEVNPSMFWFGVTGIYEMTNLRLFDIVHPYCQILLGGSTGGSLLKTGVGMQVDLYKSLSFIVGCDAGMLMYVNQGNYYLSKKVGLNTGLQMKF
ncbi:MAG: hypothetical protein HW421_2115 [Ignavibacteria bacterium]|nr:hypothetical protein [Ignavibacteria bacterium]